MARHPLLITISSLNNSLRCSTNNNATTAARTSTNPSTRHKCADTFPTAGTALSAMLAYLHMERPNSKRSATHTDRTSAIAEEAELVEEEDITRTWLAAIRAAGEAIARHKSTLTSHNPKYLVELLMFNMELSQSNIRPPHRFISSNQLEVNTNGRTNKEEASEGAEADTKAEVLTHHVLINLVPTTTTKECSNRWAACTVRISGDPTSIPKTKPTTRQSFASTSCKMRAPMKENAASLTDRPNLERSSPCSSSLRGHTKTMETKVHTKTMDQVATKSNQSKYPCRETTCLRTKITTTDSNSSSGNQTME